MTLSVGPISGPRASIACREVRGPASPCRIGGSSASVAGAHDRGGGMNDRTTGASVSASGSRASVTDAGDRASGSRMRVRGTSAPARGTIFLSANGPRVRGERISRRVIDVSGSGNARHCELTAFSCERTTRHGDRNDPSDWRNALQRRGAKLREDRSGVAWTVIAMPCDRLERMRQLTAYAHIGKTRRAAGPAVILRGRMRSLISA